VPHGPVERESWLKMLAEALREIGLLYLVFGILDAQIEARKQPNEPLDFKWFGFVFGVSAIFWLIGAVFERLRRE
jgi:hypothetical protein